MFEGQTRSHGREFTINFPLLALRNEFLYYYLSN